MEAALSPLARTQPNVWAMEGKLPVCHTHIGPVGRGKWFCFSDKAGVGA